LEQAEVRYERNPDFIFRRIVDELVLVPIRQDVADMDCIFTLNPMGAFIWEKLDGGATLSDLQAAVENEYDVDPQVAAADLAEFLGELESAGAVRRA
jgi:Coenzyme PQQ synthesis protein D (PqqD)